MADLQPGDIVSYNGQSWAVMGFAPRPDRYPPDVKLARPGRPGRFLKPDPAAEGITAGAGDVTFLERPTFTPGERVSIGGQPARVIVDDGGDTVACATGTVWPPPYRNDTARAQLTLENRL